MSLMMVSRATSRAHNLPQILKGLFSVFELEVAPVMTVFKKEATVIAVIGVFYLDDRDRSRTDILNQGVFDRLPALFVGYPADDLLIAAGLVFEEIELADQPLGQIAPQKRTVPFDFAHFKEFLGHFFSSVRILFFLGSGWLQRFSMSSHTFMPT